LLLYSDMVRLAIVRSPIVEEMATIIVKEDSGAMRGLEILTHDSVGGGARNVA
jgi:hypothetical protein